MKSLNEVVRINPLCHIGNFLEPFLSAAKCQISTLLLFDEKAKVPYPDAELCVFGG